MTQRRLASMDWYKTLCSVADSAGISVAEFLILDLVRMKVALTPPQMSCFAVTAFVHQPAVKCSQPAFEAAIETCIQNRHLRLLFRAELKMPLASWSAFANSAPSPPASVLDFTEHGRYLADQLAAKMVATRSK